MCHWSGPGGRVDICIGIGVQRSDGNVTDRNLNSIVESSWNVMAHGDAREGKWRGNCRMEWVASTLHTTSEHGVSSITTADAHTSAASSRRNWRPRRFKWTRPFRRKTKSRFCACAITFQTQSACQMSVSRSSKSRYLHPAARTSFRTH